MVQHHIHIQSFALLNQTEIMVYHEFIRYTPSMNLSPLWDGSSPHILYLNLLFYSCCGQTAKSKITFIKPYLLLVYPFLKAFETLNFLLVNTFPIQRLYNFPQSTYYYQFTISLHSRQQIFKRHEMSLTYYMVNIQQISLLGKGKEKY